MDKNMEAAMRQVREQCGYGCIVRGAPLYHYVPIGPDQSSLQNIALLCPQHLNDPREQLREQRSRPHNLKRRDNLFTFAPDIDILCLEVANNQINCDYGVIPEYCIVMIDGSPIFWINREHGIFHLNLRLFNRFNQPIAEITRNQVLMASDSFSMDYDGGRLLIKAEDALLRLSLNSAGLVRIDEARLLRNGVAFMVKDGRVALNRKVPGTVHEEDYSIDNQGNPCVFLLGPAPMVMMQNQQGQPEKMPMPALFPYPVIDRYTYE